jgi:hypothetical protein
MYYTINLVAGVAGSRVKYGWHVVQYYNISSVGGGNSWLREQLVKLVVGIFSHGIL